MRRAIPTAAVIALLVPAVLLPVEASAATSADPADGYIVYMENAGEEFNPKLRVLAKDPDGTNKRVIARNAVDVAIYDPTISPDGKYLTFNSGNEVYVMQIGKRKSLKRIDTFGDLPSEAAWSPTSDEFVFTSLVPPFFDDREIFVANPKGRYRQVTSTTANEFDAAWSPDGEWIGFTVRGTKGCTDGATQRRFNDIYISRPNGSERQLVTGALPYDWQVEDWGTTGILANAAYAGASGVLTDPCSVDGHPAHLVDPAGSTATPVLGGLDDRALALSLDDSQVLFHRAEGSNDSVWVAGLDGSEPRQIAKHTFTADWAAYPSAAME